MSKPRVPWQPRSAAEHRRRWNAAVLKVWDFTNAAPGELPPDADAPSAHPENVFDFHDGLRVIVSTDEQRFGRHLHVSASLRTGSELEKRLHAIPEPGKLAEVVRRFAQLVNDRLRAIGGTSVTLAFITGPNGVGHFYNPPLPKEVIP